MSFRHEYRRLNGVETHILLWGGVFEKSTKEVVICVTGNPGLPDFYKEFGDKLYKDTKKPVCVIGHAGHEEVPDTKSNIFKSQEEKFNLTGQLEHKLELINSIDKNVKLHLIGHSIGAWMLVELLHSNDEIRVRTASVQLLFPTLQKMAETSNGFIVNKILRTFHTLVLLFISIISVLPLPVREFFINLYLKLTSLPSHYVDRILKYVNPLVIEKVLYLAYDEMDSVRVLNREGIGKIKHMTNVIYSDRDGWAPVSQIEDLREYEPALLRQMVTYRHAFVLRSSDEVADMTSKFIKTISS